MQKQTLKNTFFELMNNAFFGRTMENIRDRVNLEVISHDQIQQIINRQSKLSFKVLRIIMEILVCSFIEKKIFDKPIYLGFCVRIKQVINV